MICVGPEGPGPWTEKELDVAHDLVVRESARSLIPVLLSGASQEQLDQGSLFLRQYQSLDLSLGISEDGISRAVAAIRRAQEGEPTERRIPGAPTPAVIEPILMRLQSRFSESLRHNLAGGQLIRRKETQELLALLEEETTRIVVVHGTAGSGKSGVLFELAEDLAGRGISFLPLRLDRHQEHLRGNPKRFAHDGLELTESPAKSLAAVGAEKGGILLIDQLDAIRWTAAHSSEAWDVCREMILEALSITGLKVVVCCRTFDLEHDPQLRGWERDTKNLRRVEVQKLSLEDVEAAIGAAGFGVGVAPALGPKEQDLLRHIHHLQMWLAIYRTTEAIPRFDSAWRLMEKFWATRLDELAKDGLARQRAEELEVKLVEAVKKGAVLTGSLRGLGMTEREKELYQHQHLLQIDEVRGRFIFSHQSYQDYLIAKYLLGELDKCTPAEAPEKLVAWLGGREEQSLARREQLRLLLVALRAEEHKVYLATLQSLLSEPELGAGEAIRFHLRLLALQFLGQVSDPRAEEVGLVLALLDRPFWREHVLAEVLRGQAPWFEALDDRGIWAAWLANQDENYQRQALHMLLYAAEKCGDRVARLLMPYMEKDATWTQNILGVLPFDPTHDSDALFEVRLGLAKTGAYDADHIEWDKLATSQPDRFVKLATYILLAFALSVSRGEDRHRPGRHPEISWLGLDKLNSYSIPGPDQAFAWEMLFRAASLAVQAGRYEGEAGHVLESYAVDFENLMPVVQLLKNLAAALLEENWLEFVTLGEEASRVGRPVEVLFLDGLVEGPTSPDLADWALIWLMADPWRARLKRRRGSGWWVLPGQLIARYAPICSPETFQRLERWLLEYVEPDLLENYKRRHRWVTEDGDLRDPGSFGETAHRLLPRLPAERRSAATELRIKELERKFSSRRLSKEDEEEVHAGWVGSPLSEDTKAGMTDAGWLKIATNQKLSKRSSKWRFKKSPRGDGLIEEASIETFSSDFRSMAQRQPERFAKLASLFPSDTHRAYGGAILAGLAWPGNQPPSEDWSPPTHAALEAMLQLRAMQALICSDDSEGARNFCDLLGCYPKYPWSETALQRLVWVAQHHSDPNPAYYPIGSSNQGSEVFDRLDDNALNVTRGRAAFAISKLLFAQPALFEALRPALESLVQDEHPAVRVAALAACLPVINIDRDLAVQWFLQACEGPDAILGTREASRFLRYTYRTHLHQLRPTIERMVRCPLSAVATAGAIQVAACFLVEGQLEEQFEACLTGVQPQRKGIAEVAASLLGEGDFAEAAKTTLLRLAEDNDDGVARAVASSFKNLDLRWIRGDRETWNAFARSKAFQANPSPLLQALDRQTGNLLPFADCLLEVGATFAGDLAEASKNMATRSSGHVRQLLPLLLRLYEQAKDQDNAVYLRCLDLWDRLLERRVGAAMGLTKELDQV